MKSLFFLPLCLQLAWSASIDYTAGGGGSSPSAPAASGSYGSAPAPPAPAPPSYGSAPVPPAPAPPSYGSAPAPSYSTAAPYNAGGGYGQNCKTYYETVQVDKCEKYNERVCYTTNQEECQDVPDQNCRGIVSSQQIRQCFNVTELKCGLKEDVQYEVVQAVFTVQKCHTVTERVCDTVYETVDTSKDSFQCINIKNSVCQENDQTLYDKTCKTTTKFDCNYGGYGGYGAAPAGAVAATGSAGGYGNAGGSAGGYGGDSKQGYEEESYCKRTQNTQCYTTPRLVKTEQCFPKDQQVCEKLINTGPQPKEKQVCHNEEKKVCELEQRSQPKQIKKYVYTTACQSVPRSVCDNADYKRLVPSCVPVVRKTCTYTPSAEKCEDIPKDYCYKVPKKIAKQKCYGPGYGSDGDDGASYES